MTPSFVLFHAENVNEDKNAICHLILIPVVDGVSQSPQEFFFNPEAPFQMVQSGIKASQVETFESFSLQWPKVQKIFNQFDMAVCSAEGYSARSLYNTLTRLDVDFSPIHYCNAKAICRRTMNEVSYSIDYLSYKLYDDAVYPDEPVKIAQRWCDLALKGLNSAPENSFVDFFANAKIQLGKIATDSFIPSLCKKYHSKPRWKNQRTLDESAIEIDADPDNPFFGMNVVFTGKMSISRNDARASVIRIGGIAPEGLTQETDFLVVGTQDLRVVGEKGLSGKMKTAAKYREKGLPIEIIDEQDFLEMIGSICEAPVKKKESPTKRNNPFLTLEDVDHLSQEEIQKRLEVLEVFKKHMGWI